MFDGVCLAIKLQDMFVVSNFQSNWNWKVVFWAIRTSLKNEKEFLIVQYFASKEGDGAMTGDNMRGCGDNFFTEKDVEEVLF